MTKSGHVFTLCAINDGSVRLEESLEPPPHAIQRGKDVLPERPWSIHFGTAGGAFRMAGFRHKAMLTVISIGLGLALPGITASARLPAGGSEPPVFVVRDFGAVPKSAHQWMLLRNRAVRKELGITGAQMAGHARIEMQFARDWRSARQGQPLEGDAHSREIRAALGRFDREIAATLTAKQRERLDQIQLQAQGPLAFAPEEQDTRGMVQPPLEKRLELNEEQLQQARAIFQESIKQIEKAASFPIVVPPENGQLTMRAVRKLVESPEFEAAKDKAGRAGREASAATVRRIEAVLNDRQRKAYREMIGEPFEFAKLQIGATRRRRADLDRGLVAALVGLNEGPP